MSGAITLNGVFEAKAQARLIEYDVKFTKSLAVDGPGDDYLAEYTYTPPVGPEVYDVRLPIPLSAPELKLFKGRRHFRKNSTAFIDITKAPYDDGVEEYYKKIAAYDFVGFSTTPQALATIIRTWKSRNGVGLLNSGESYTDWTGGNFLATTKYSNPFNKTGSTTKTFRNYWASTQLTADNVRLLIADMVGRRGFNGEPLGFGQKDMVLFASPENFTDAQAICLDERLASGATNPIVKYRLKPVCFQHLSAKRWGILQGGSAVETHPVFGAIASPPDALVLGVGSALYEKKAYMGYNVMVDLGIALMRYEAISVAVNP